MNIRFTWDGKNYTVGYGVYSSSLCIVLPDSTVLRPTSWLQSFPPKLGGAKIVHHLFQNLPATEVATHMGGIVATEVTE